MDDGSKDVTTEVAQGIKTLKENISKGGNFPDIKMLFIIVIHNARVFLVPSKFYLHKRLKGLSKLAV